MPYAPSNDPAVHAAAQNILAVINGSGDNDVGNAAYAALMNDPSLTARQKQEVCCEVGRGVVTHGMTLPGVVANPDLLLRESCAGTAFMTAAIKEMTPRYFEAVTKAALTAGAQHGLNGVGDASQDLVDSISGQKHRFSPDACDFMQACAAGIPEGLAPAERQMAEQTLAVNTILLRGVSPAITEARVAVTANPHASQAQKDACRAAFEASIAVQRFANTMPQDFLIAEDHDVGPHVLALMGNDAAKQQLVDTMQQMADGNHAQLQVGAPQSVGATLKSAVGRDLASKLGDAEQKLDRRQQKLDQLRGDKQQHETFADHLVNQFQKQDGLTPAQVQQGAKVVNSVRGEVERLDRKITRQERKVESSEQKVDKLQSRVGRH